MCLLQEKSRRNTNVCLVFPPYISLAFMFQALHFPVGNHNLKVYKSSIANKFNLRYHQVAKKENTPFKKKKIHCYFMLLQW